MDTIARTWTHEDFESLSWHDCAIWALQIRAGDPDAGDWTSNLALDVDFIVEWVCGAGTTPQFQVAPATLVFQGVTDLAVSWSSGTGAYQGAVHPLTIDRIEREPLVAQRVYLDRPYFIWRVHLNWPAAGLISFGAWGFRQTLRREPILLPHQQLSGRARGFPDWKADEPEA